jgi:HEPN domain-containing protein
LVAGTTEEADVTAPVPEQWVAQARYDFESARAMLESGRFLYVLFCCQQSVEKLLKAVIAAQTGELPPRTHNLVQLASHAGLKPEENQVQLMRQLSEYYVQSRYPDAMEEGFEDVPQHEAAAAMAQTEKVMEWLSSLL